MNDYDQRSFRILKKLKLVFLVKVLLVIKDEGFKGLFRKFKSRKHAKSVARLAQENNINLEINRSDDSIINVESGSVDIVLDPSFDKEAIQEDLKDLSVKYNLYVLANVNEKKDGYYEITEMLLKETFLYRSFIYITSKKKVQDDFYNCIVLNSAEDLCENIERKLQDIKGFKLISNYNNRNCVTVKTSTFFNDFGTNYYSGGAERYLVDLYDVCKKLNLNMDIYQNGKVPFVRKFRNINVFGMPSKNASGDYTQEYVKKQAEQYFGYTKNSSLLHIHSAFFECYPYRVSPSIGISHGVAWDSKGCVKTDGNDFWRRNERIIESACMCDRLVSVDTNTANWFQTIDFELGNQRVKVIPNYVDTNEFYKDDSLRDNKDKIVITYPRRLYEPRGLYLLLDIVDDLFEKYDNIEVHFVGKGFDEDVNKIKEKMEKYPDKLFCYSQIPEKMHEVYKKTDISLIPTLYSEGTSLSCLEAMATENIVIATRIGGLTDLIIDGYNGYLIEPTKEDLLGTLSEVIENYAAQDVIRKRARESAEVFNKKRWALSWKKELEYFDIEQTSQNIDLVEFYLTDADNLSEKVLEMIFKELKENKLVYLRFKKELKQDDISGGLLQVVPWDEEVVSKAEVIYKEKGLEIAREERIIEL